MKSKLIVLASLSLLVFSPVISSAKTAAHAKKTMAVSKYQCVKCNMEYSAADAKKDKFKCPMDGGKLVKEKAAKPAAMKMKPMHKM